MKGISLILVVSGLTGAVCFGAGYYFAKNELPWAEASEQAPKTAPVSSEKTPEDLVLQDGKAVSLKALMATYKQNPNRFNSITEKSKFVVEGRIRSIGEASVLDKVSGFPIPLKYSVDEVDRTISAMEEGRIGLPLPVTIFVKGLTEDQIANFDPGQKIIVECPKVRIVVDGFVFDDCAVQKEASK